MVILNEADSNQTKFGLFIFDGVPAGNDDAGFEGFFSSPAQDSLGDFEGQVGWKGGNVEGKEGYTAHRIDIRKGIGGSDGTVIVGIVDDGSEVVEGGDQGMAFVEAPDSSVIGGIKPDEEIRVNVTLKSLFDWQQNLRQRFRVDFGCSARAGGERSQADGWGVSHGVNDN